MNKEVYDAMYKCRLCGEAYAPPRPIFHMVHTCSKEGYEGSIGVGDFIGWKAKMIDVKGEKK